MRIKQGGNVTAAVIVTRVEPNYPEEARRRRIEGRVVVHAIIGIDGAVKDLEVISGPQELTQSALDAVRQWRYKPTLLNGQPVEVDTTIAVEYVLPRVSDGPATPSADKTPAPALTRIPSMAEATAQREKEREAQAAVDPEMAADVRRLLELTGGIRITSMIFNSFMPTVKEQLLRDLPASEDRDKIVDTFIRKMEERVSSSELVDIVIPIFAKHFTREDIKNSLAFYDSPTGKRLIQDTPAYVQDVQTAASKHWMNIVMPELLKEMADEFPKGKSK
jgi:TonB family protein